MFSTISLLCDSDRLSTPAAQWLVFGGNSQKELWGSMEVICGYGKEQKGLALPVFADVDSTFVLRKHSKVKAPVLILMWPQDRGWDFQRHPRAQSLLSHWILMGFECLTPAGFSENLSFGSSGQRLFHARQPLSQKSRVYGGRLQRLCVLRGAWEGPREDEFIFELVWLNYRHNAHTASADCAGCSALGSVWQWLRACKSAITAPGSSIESVGRRRIIH